MKLSLSKLELVDYLAAQIGNFFPEAASVRRDELRRHIDTIMQRMEACFSRINNSYFCDNEDTLFNHLHADQYAMFLYLAANTIFRQGGDISLCEKIFQLNRSLHGIDAFYEINLPEIFLFVHPIGTILGRGEYSNYFMVYQNCGVGSNHDVFPKFDEYVSLHPGASVLGDCRIGRNCKISTGSLIMDRNLVENSVYIGNTLRSEIKKAYRTLDIWKK